MNRMAKIRVAQHSHSQLSMNKATLHYLVSALILAKAPCLAHGKHPQNVSYCLQQGKWGEQGSFKEKQWGRGVIIISGRTGMMSCSQTEELNADTGSHQTQQRHVESMNQ